MNSDLYCDIIVNKLKPAIRNKRRGKLSKGVLFLYDNARPHTSCKTVYTIIKLDLAPSDYFLFGLLKKELKGKRFDSDEDVQKVVQDFFHTLPKSAYKEDIYKLPERWRRCIESQAFGYYTALLQEYSAVLQRRSPCHPRGVLHHRPDLQSWIIPVGLEDRAITISSAAKYAIYVFFVDREIRGVAGDPLAILHQTLQWW
ncbi:hypothetical protein LAZ67_18002623 [Cordylochernes scorpioides]|uniref:Histone-lysine N-methyltransferase SETMAR n=1 Tax=Cordylochernes scorpioides TaxID=51811 RepID=A0ABY6LJ96_9ARAC|nr:hypothetical protein LAZ67_18002623 [Cordylochernes scorpioides]